MVFFSKKFLNPRAILPGGNLASCSTSIVLWSRYLIPSEVATCQLFVYNFDLCKEDTTTTLLSTRQPASILWKKYAKVDDIFFSFLSACVSVFNQPILNTFIQAILLESPNRQLTLGDIYKWFTTNFKYFRTTSNLTWKVNMLLLAKMLIRA